MSGYDEYLKLIDKHDNDMTRKCIDFINEFSLSRMKLIKEIEYGNFRAIHYKCLPKDIKQVFNEVFYDYFKVAVTPKIEK